MSTFINSLHFFTLMGVFVVAVEVFREGVGRADTTARSFPFRLGTGAGRGGSGIGAGVSFFNLGGARETAGIETLAGVALAVEGAGAGEALGVEVSDLAAIELDRSFFKGRSSISSTRGSERLRLLALTAEEVLPTAGRAGVEVADGGLKRFSSSFSFSIANTSS
jgi:hypothetical protein